MMSPAVSKKQQHLMGADLKRKRKGQKTLTGLSEAQLEDFASTKTTDLPTKKRKKVHT